LKTINQLINQYNIYLDSEINRRESYLT